MNVEGWLQKPKFGWHVGLFQPYKYWELFKVLSWSLLFSLSYPVYQDVQFLMARSCSDLFLKIRVSSSTSPHKPWQSSVMSVLSFHDISYKWDHLTWILFYFIGVMFGGFRHSAFLSDLNQYILLISLLVTFSFVPIICPHKGRRNHLKMTKKEYM